MKLILGLVFAIVLSAQTKVGPARGHLIVAGGGALGPEIVDRFISLAGGPDAPIVIIPTADDLDQFPADYAAASFLAKAGAKRVTMLHTRHKPDSDTDAFVAALKQAGGVWFTGGRHWRLVDSYLGTKVHRELMALLDRGGVIGGTSAGATIQGSFMVRGARSGNTIMVDPDYHEGLAFLRGVSWRRQQPDQFYSNLAGQCFRHEDQSRRHHARLDRDLHRGSLERQLLYSTGQSRQ